MDDISRQRRVVRIASHLLLQWLSEGFPDPAEIIRDALPKDSRIVDAKFNDWDCPNTLILLVESPQFTPIREGDRIPAIEPIYRTISRIAEPGLMALAGVEPAGTDYKMPKDTRLA